MTDAPNAHLESLRSTIVEVFPYLARSSFRLITGGWDSLVVEVDDSLIFKVPRDPAAEMSLLKEAALLAVIRPAASMSIPDMSIYRQPSLFSRHEKLRGEHLTTAIYSDLSDHAKDAMAVELGRFYAQLHSLDANLLRSAGAEAVFAWQTTQAIRERGTARIAS